MKINNILKVLFGAAVIAGFASCDDEVKYVPAEATPGVFFPVKNTSAVTLDPDGVSTSFDFVVARTGSLAVQSFTFTNNFPEGITMPAQVTFAEGEELQTITVSYDVEVLAPGKYNLEIGFAEGQQVSQVGLNVLKIAVTLPEPVEVLPWNDLGECTFSDPFVSKGLFNGIPSLTYKVHIEESGDTPGLYRLVAPYGTAFADAWLAAFDGDEDEALGAVNYDSENQLYLEIHAEDPEKVYIVPQMIGVHISLEGPMMGMNLAGYFIANEREPSAASYGKMVDGVITLPAKTSLVAFPEYDEPGPYYASNSAVKMIVMPGVNAGDYSAKVQFMGQFNNANTGVISAVATAEFGEDVAYAKAGIINASTGASLITAIENGTYDAVDVNLNDPVVSLPVYQPGSYTIAYVTYDDAGQPQDSGFATFDIEVFANDEAAWDDLGYATFADGWLIGGFWVEDPDEITDLAYDVLAQESVNVPGLYRFVNAFGAGNVVGEMTTTPVNTTFYVDATDPEFITIVPQFTGFTYGNFGSVYAFNWEGYYFDLGYGKADVVGAGRISTTIEDGMIFVSSPLMCGTGPAFASGWGAYGAGDYSVIFLPEENGEPSPAAMQVKKAASKVLQANKTFAPEQRKFQSTFKLSYKKSDSVRQIASDVIKF